jgi:hypothetical protein
MGNRTVSQSLTRFGMLDLGRSCSAQISRTAKAISWPLSSPCNMPASDSLYQRQR